MFLVPKGANSGFCRRYPIVIVGLKRDAPGRALGPALPPRRCGRGTPRSGRGRMRGPKPRPPHPPRQRTSIVASGAAAFTAAVPVGTGAANDGVAVAASASAPATPTAIAFLRFIMVHPFPSRALAGVIQSLPGHSNDNVLAGWGFRG